MAVDESAKLLLGKGHRAELRSCLQRAPIFKVDKSLPQDWLLKLAELDRADAKAAAD